MRNPLTQACLDITRAGYTNAKEINSRYHNPTMVQLASYLLNHGKPSHEKHSYHYGPKNRRIAICFGGGIDSYCAWHFALRNCMQSELIQCNYGQPYFGPELDVYLEIYSAWRRVTEQVLHGDTPFLKPIFNATETIKSQTQVAIETITQLCKFTTNIYLPLITEEEESKDFSWADYIIPARNLALAAIGAERHDEVWIVATSRGNDDVGTPDKTSKFFELTSQAFSEFYGRRVVVRSPFLGKSKMEVVQDYLSNGGDIESLKATFSCYSPARKDYQVLISSTLVEDRSVMMACGHCYACYKKWSLFNKLGSPFERFVHDPEKGPNFQKYVDKETAKGR